MITHVPLPDYRPDLTVHSTALTRAENVIPTVDGYRGVGAIQPVSDALSGQFNGAASAISEDGIAWLLAGTGTALYRLTLGAWHSLSTGLSVGERWRFAQFKNYVITVNGGATGVVDLSAGAWSLIAGAPTANSVTVIGDYVVYGQANANVAMVRWSAFNDHTGNTIGTDQCGEDPMSHGGAVMGISGGEYGVVLQRNRIVRMTRTGISATPFYFDEISADFGCAASATFAAAGRTVFFYSDRGFMAIEDGQQLRPIGTEKVDRTFESLVGRNNLENVHAAVDPANKLVFWCVPGSPGVVFTYNFELDKWSVISVANNGLFPGYTTSISLDDFTAAGYPNLDTVGISLDDPRWTGGAPRLYVVDKDNKIGALTGDKLAARLDMAFIELAPQHRTRLRKIRPVTDCIGGMTVELNAKARLGDAESTTTYASLTPSGIVPVRAAGRYIATSVRIDAGAKWDFIQALEYEFEQAGLR